VATRSVAVFFFDMPPRWCGGVGVPSSFEKNTHHPLDGARQHWDRSFVADNFDKPLLFFRKVDIQLTLTLHYFDFATQLPTTHFTIDNSVACYITSNLLETGHMFL